MTRKTDVYDQLLNVMQGYTADGDVRGAPIAMPGGNLAIGQLGLILNALFRDLEQHIPEQMQSDAVRTALILVLVRWLKLLGLLTATRLGRIARRVAPTH
ncbi:hypothetical protein [Hyphomicrobium sp. DY-1]|uniref:hypothetical protein n=1 Tax=Hyphomicrobium sp. DY-1 TaxID=3075650 RepID=UPI0039C242BC